MNHSPSRRELEDVIDERIRLALERDRTATRSAGKDALKGAYKEVVQEILARFGGWTLAALGAVVVSALLWGVFYLVALKTGWTPPPK